MFLRKYKTNGIVLLSFACIVMQVMFCVRAEAKDTSDVSTVEGTHPVEFYAYEDNSQPNWNTQDIDRSKDIKNVYYIMQNSKFKDIRKDTKRPISKKYKGDANNTKWYFAKSTEINPEEWENSARLEKLMPHAPSYSSTKMSSKETSSNYLSNSNLNNVHLFSEYRDDINLTDNIRLVSKKETRGAVFNNTKGVHVDQQLYINRTETYGAYAEIYLEDDFSFTVGPEYSHSNETSVGQGEVGSSSELGIGFQLMLGF